MKKIKSLSLLIFIVALPLLGSAQAKYFTREGHIQFKSDAEAEFIEANNYKVTSIIDFTTGKIEFVLLMKAFEFKKALMEEHFNENYLESELYPKSNFKGSIQNVDSIKLDKDGLYKVIVEGELTIHGVTKSVIIPASIIVNDEGIVGQSIFTINLHDYNIKIPSIVIKNIAEEIQVIARLNYIELRK